MSSRLGQEISSAYEGSRALARAISSFTSATGELVTQTRIFEKASFVAEAKLLDARPLYVRLGDWVSPLCALAVSYGLFARRRPNRRS